MSAIATKRLSLTKDLDTKKASLRELRAELKLATGADKNRLLSMIKTEMRSVREAEYNLGHFEDAPIILPDLKAVKLTIQFHPDNRAFDATVWVNNDSPLPALGSFEVDLSVSFYTYAQDPPLLDNATFKKTEPDSSDVQPGGTNQIVFPNIPFVTKPGSSTASYTFDASLFAGPGGVVGDNTLHLVLSLRPPIISRPPAPTVNAPVA